MSITLATVIFKATEILFCSSLSLSKGSIRQLGMQPEMRIWVGLMRKSEENTPSAMGVWE